MTTMSVEQAETLYTILDKHVGMFSFEGINQKAQEFCKKKRLEFVNLFSVVGIPDLYWFQGVKCASADLIYNAERNIFEVVSEIDCKNVRKTIEEMNKDLYRHGFRR